MQVVCPQCSQPVAGEDINVAKDTAFCRSCNNVFSLSGQVHGGAPPRSPEPDQTRVIFTRDRDHIAAVIPGQLKGLGCFFLGFAAFWNGITWFMLIMAVFKDGLPTRNGMGWAAALFNMVELLFFIPFVLVGLVTAVGALYCIFGEAALAMDRYSVIFHRRLGRFKWPRTMPFEAIENIRSTESYKSNDVPVNGVGIHFAGGAAYYSATTTQQSADISSIKGSFGKRPMVFGSELSEPEKQWLLGEFYSFWSEQKGR